MKTDLKLQILIWRDSCDEGGIVVGISSASTGQGNEEVARNVSRVSGGPYVKHQQREQHEREDHIGEVRVLRRGSAWNTDPGMIVIVRYSATSR